MITKLLPLIATLCSSAFGFTGAGDLTLVSDATFNKLQVTITASCSRAHLLLEKSTTSPNSGWSAVDPADVSLGVNPIPPGRSGPVSVLLRSTTGRCFLRVVANQP